jgi:type VI secretion system secreted protein Hcp
MAVVDMFLQIPGITGESTDKAFTGATELESFSFGAHNAATIGSATGGGGAGKVSLSDFSIMKKIDKASPVMFQGCAAGTHYKTATLSVRKAGGTQLVYLTYTFSTVFITSINWSASSGEENPTESVAFTYGALNISYQPQGPTGAAQGGAVIGQWSQITNTASST